MRATGLELKKSTIVSGFFCTLIEQDKL